MMPLLSLFLTEEIGVRPMYMGSFLGVMTGTALVIGLWVGQISDHGTSRKHLIYWGQCALIIVALTFAFNRNYWVILVIASIFLGIGNTGFPQLFAMARQHSDESNVSNSASFMSLMRAQISLAWIIGPPAAFFLVDHYGFHYTFLSTGLMALMVMAVTRYGIPKQSKTQKRSSEGHGPVWYRDANVLRFVVACLLFNSAACMYLIAMPLYLVNELGESVMWAGYLMGVAAFLEIPVMLATGRIADRIGKKNIMLISLAAGIVFHSGIYWATELWQLFALQIFNGIFIGVTGSLGIIIVQDLMPTQIGMATTVFSSTMRVAYFVASVVVGGIADFFDYQSVFWISLGTVVISFILFTKIEEKKPSAQISQNAA